MIGTTLIYVIIFRDCCPCYTLNPGRVFILPFFSGGRGSMSTRMEPSRPGTEAGSEWKEIWVRVGADPLDANPPCPRSGRTFLFPSYFLALISPRKKRQPLPWSSCHLSALGEFGPRPHRSAHLPCPLPAAPRAGEPTERPGTEESPQPHGGTRGEGPGGTPGQLPLPSRIPPAPALPAGHSPRTSPAAASSHTASSCRPIPGDRGWRQPPAGPEPPGDRRQLGPFLRPHRSRPCGAAGWGGAEGCWRPAPAPCPSARRASLPSPIPGPGRGSGAAGRLFPQPERCGALGRAAEPGVIERSAGAAPPAPAPLPGPSARSFPFAVSSGCCCDRRDCPKGRRGAPGRGAAAWGAGGEGSRAGSQGTVLSQQFGSGHIFGRREMGEMMLHTWLLNPQGLNRAGGSGAGSFV